MNELKKFDTILGASKELNISYSSIKAVLRKKTKYSWLIYLEIFRLILVL